MKVLEKDQIKDERAVDQILTERNVMAQVESPFIVDMKYALTTKSKLIFISELMGGGHMLYYIANLHRVR